MPIKKRNENSIQKSTPFNKSPVIPPISSNKTSEQSSTISHDWYQTNTVIVITLYTKKLKSISANDVLVEIIEDGAINSDLGNILVICNRG